MNVRDFWGSVLSFLLALVIGYWISKIGGSAAFGAFVFIISFASLEIIDRLNRIRQILIGIYNEVTPTLPFPVKKHRIAKR